MKKLYSFLPALIFLVFLGVMALLLLFSPVRDYSENEKRYLAGRPEVTVSGILEGETQEQLEKFTADQVPGRDFFVGSTPIGIWPPAAMEPRISTTASRAI